ncbi:MAG: hypothetical protein H7X88_09320 [Gloeobacteraceae cyanobacterium ES-bin-316]|nr:hypothetical protein [Ferruginibacter sp.]
MKAFIFLSVLLNCSTGLVAQTKETIILKGADAIEFIEKSEYRFPEFTRGKVYLKNGEVASAKLNFDYFKDAMKYIDQKGDTLLIANLEDIKFISIGLDSFFIDGKFFEWMATSATTRLSVRRTLKLAQSQLTGAYGTTSAAHNVESRASILETNSYKLDLNQQLEFVKETAFYISSVKGDFMPANKKNISRLFPDKKIDEFVKENKLNLNKEKDLLDLFVFASADK